LIGLIGLIGLDSAGISAAGILGPSSLGFISRSMKC